MKWLALGGLVIAIAVTAAVIASRGRDQPAPRPPAPQPATLDRGLHELATGDSATAITTLERAYRDAGDRFGYADPRLASYLDALASARAARGEIRAALGLHEKSLALAKDRATSLAARAATKLEAGDTASARQDVEAALALGDRPELHRLLGDIRAAMGLTDLASQAYAAAGSAAAPAPLDPHEALTIERATQLAQLAIDHRDAALAHALRDRYRPELDAHLAVPIGNALLAVGDRTAAAAVFTAAAKHVGNEPTRTALATFVGLARATGNAQAARTAISLYQAMPLVTRPDYDAMWALTR